MVSIFHCADLHLDSPFAALTPEEAARRRRAQRQLPERLVALCRERDCDLLLLAGDVFDSARVRPETLEALQGALRACPVPVFIAPGNHDPYTPDSPWARLPWPSHVHIFRGPWESIDLPDRNCRVWGSGFTCAQCDLVPPPVERSDRIQIGLLHGDPTGPGPYRYLSRQDLAGSGLDYLALGHIHQTALPRRAGETWYAWPGVTLGRGFDETGPHGALHVLVGKGTCQAQFCPLPGPRYEILTLPAGEDLSIPADSADLICRLVLTGEQDAPDLDALHYRLSPHFRSLELRDETLPPLDLWASCGDGTLRGLALEALKTQYDAPGVDRRTIALAARYLLAAVEGREAP